jgi:hypothetical protein
MHISFTIDFDTERQEIHTAFSSAFTNWEKNDEDSEEKAEQSRICRQILRQHGESGFVREAEIWWIIDLIELKIVEYQKDIEELNKMDPHPLIIIKAKKMWNTYNQRSQENFAQRIEEMKNGIKVLARGARLIGDTSAFLRGVDIPQGEPTGKPYIV